MNELKCKICKKPQKGSAKAAEETAKKAGVDVEEVRREGILICAKCVKGGKGKPDSESVAVLAKLVMESFKDFLASKDFDDDLYEEEPTKKLRFEFKLIDEEQEETVARAESGDWELFQLQMAAIQRKHNLKE